MKSLKTELIKHIENKKVDLFSYVQEALRIPSICGNEGAAQKWIAEKYRDIGLDVEFFQADREKISKHPAFIDSGITYNDRPNIIGILRGDPAEKSVILNGHIDVVSPEPVSSWQYNPWSGEISDGRIWGRGSADMKGGLMANYFAIKSLLDLDIKPKGPVMLQSVVEEEAGGGPGTLACLMENYQADGFVATEPHALRVTVAHAGILYFKVKVQGRTSHAGLAHLGVNAIGKMYPIYQALIELDEVRGKEVQFELFTKGSGRSTHLNIGKMLAGDWPSTVAGWAELEGRISFVPGESRQGIKELIYKVVKDVSNRDPWLREFPPTIEWYGWHTDAWHQDPETTYVRSFRDTAASVLGYEVEVIGRASGNDARFTQYFHGMSGICFGPEGGNIHGIDEYVTLESLVKTTQVLAAHIVDWCKIE